MPKSVEEMSDGELEQLFRNCLSAIAGEKPNATRAATKISAINAVWRKRLAAAQAGSYKPESPETGVLKTIGYRVGRQGEKTKTRWALLDFVMRGELPFVGSPAHMAEWGEPNGLVRYRKLHRVLAGFRTSAANRPELAQAFADWAEDLDWLETEWRPKVR